MRAPSYAVYWNEGTGPRYAGRVEMRSTCAELSGAAVYGRRSLQRILFDDIAAIAYANGRLRIDRRDGGELEIGSVDAPGALRELADRLVAATAS